MTGLIDLHSHVLPGIDDGPADTEGALALARAAVEAGTTTLVATPHVNHRYSANEPVVIAERVEQLRADLAAAGIALELLAGAEVALTRATELTEQQLAALRLGGGPYLLVECPSTPSAAGFEAALDWIAARGSRVLLAHAERVPGLATDLGLVERLVARGVLVQVTAASLSGRFGDGTRRTAERMLRAGLVHDIASDAHHAEQRGPQILGHLREAGLEDHAGHYARDMPRAILDGAPLPPAPHIAAPRRRRLFRRA